MIIILKTFLTRNKSHICGEKCPFFNLVHSCTSNIILNIHLLTSSCLNFVHRLSYQMVAWILYTDLSNWSGMWDCLFRFVWWWWWSLLLSIDIYGYVNIFSSPYMETIYEVYGIYPLMIVWSKKLLYQIKRLLGLNKTR